MSSQLTRAVPLNAEANQRLPMLQCCVQWEACCLLHWLDEVLLFMNASYMLA